MLIRISAQKVIKSLSQQVGGGGGRDLRHNFVKTGAPRSDRTDVGRHAVV